MTAFKLTKKKRAKARPGQVLRGTALIVPVPIERRYRKDVDNILRAVIKATEQGVRNIFKTPVAQEYYAEDESITSVANDALDKMFARLDELAERQARVVSTRMIKGVNTASRLGMNASLKELSGGVTLSTSELGGHIKEKLAASIESNVDLITSMTKSHMSKVSDAVNRSIMSGNGLQDLVPFMQKQKGITMRHGRNVALDQTRKAYTSLNEERMQSVGLSKFEWLHSGGGQRPRKYHQDRWPEGLNGGIFDINDPPVIDQKTKETGLPAHAPNCKCRMIPVLVMD